MHRTHFIRRVSTTEFHRMSPRVCVLKRKYYKTRSENYSAFVETGWVYRDDGLDDRRSRSGPCTDGRPSKCLIDVDGTFIVETACLHF